MGGNARISHNHRTSRPVPKLNYMKHTTILGAFTGCLLLLALVTHSIFAWVLFGMLGIGWLGKLAERDLK